MSFPFAFQAAEAGHGWTPIPDRTRRRFTISFTFEDGRPTTETPWMDAAALDDWLSFIGNVVRWDFKVWADTGARHDAGAEDAAARH